MKRLFKKNNQSLRIIGTLLTIIMLFTVFTACTVKDKDQTAGTDRGTALQTEETSSNEKETQENSNKSNDIEEESTKNTVGDTTSQVEESTNIFPLKVIDANGAEVEIEKKPERIVSLTLTTDEMLLSLVDKKRITALSHLSDDPGLSNVVKEAAEIPVKARLELESLISMQPDLIIVADWTDENSVKQLRDANITVYSLATPNNIDEVKDAVFKVSELVGEKEKGQEIVDWMDEKLKAVEDKVKTLKENDKLKALYYDSYLCTYGKGSTFDDITKKAGIINLASEQGMGMFQEISKEKIVELNPDILLLPSWSYEGFDAEQFTKDFKNDKSLATINAIKNDRVFNLPDAHIITTSQNIVLAVEDVARAAYPELFK
ncbi:MAG TPA: ABC transporter substrate-binding protein [Clostridiaceae bacterium]|jgi:iron complex transport system substrate-binding protein|nr:ABC transporter substrate-binding protein [Clostridiaceae bacterium]